MQTADRELPSGHARQVGKELSERELEVMALVARGYTTKEIAAALGIADRTVKFHVGRVFEKLQVVSRAEAISALLSGGRVFARVPPTSGPRVGPGTARGRLIAGSRRLSRDEVRRI